MVSFGIVTIICAAASLFSFVIAKPRDPHSPRFPQSSDKSAGEFVLWSCTATAELHKNNNDHKNIIKIVTAAGDYPTGSGAYHKPNPPPRKDDDHIHNINIIKLNRIPNRHGDKPAEILPKKTNSQSNTEPTADEGTKHKNILTHKFDSPLKTITVNSFRKDMPVLFKEKPQLPEIDHRILREDEPGAPLHSSEITVIKM